MRLPVCGVLLSAVLLSGPALAAPAIEERVALLPVVAVNADRSNEALLTQALAANLSRHGCKLVEEATVREVVAAGAGALGQPQFLPTLVRLGDELGADLVVYTRILVQGPSVQGSRIDPTRPAMVVLTNVADARTGELLMAKQISQEWTATDLSAPEQTATQEAAQQAAERLLALLYQPVDLKGQLTDVSSGRPLAGAEVFLRQAGVETRVMLTDAEGRFAFPQIARRPMTLSTHAAGYHNFSRNLSFTLGEKLVDVALTPRAAAVAGYVRRPDGSEQGAPVAGHPVRLLDAGGKLLDSLSTLSDGSFGRGGLKSGRYTVAVPQPDGTVQERVVQLGPGDLTTVEFQLRLPPATARASSAPAAPAADAEREPAEGQ